MKIAVIGAGVAGITTAHALAQSGHEVMVFERSSAAAEGASFANAGLLSPSLSNVVAHPVWPDTRWFNQFGALQHIDVSAAARLRHWQWHSRWRRPPRADIFLSNIRAAQALVSLSREVIQELEADPHLTHERSEGCLVLMRPYGESPDLQGKLDVLKEQKIKFDLLAPDEVRLKESALGPGIGSNGAIYLPDETTHNSRHFALQLRSKVLKAGGTFKFGHEVTQLTGGDSPSLGVEGGSEIAFDHIVVCTGLMPCSLTASLKFQLPITPITGYSLSAPLREPTYAPQATVIDLTNGLTIGRIGKRIRVTGGYSLGASRTGARMRATKVLFDGLQRYFPGATQSTSGTQFWGGTVASLPDGLPAIGQSGLEGVWLNVAHGTSGWGMACGSAELISAMISNKPPPLDPEPFSPRRF